MKSKGYNTNIAICQNYRIFDLFKEALEEALKEALETFTFCCEFAIIWYEILMWF